MEDSEIVEEEMACFGCIASKYDIRDYKLDKSSVGSVVLPKTYKLPMAGIKNQGSSPTCVAHASSSIVEYFNKEQQGTDVDFSTEFIYGYRPAGYYQGEGMYTTDALKTLLKVGDVETYFLPGNESVKSAVSTVNNFGVDKLTEQAYPNRISAYFKITTLEELKYAIYTYGPVLVSMKWYDGAKLKYNTYTYNSSNSSSGHAVLAIGWTEDKIIIQNSWGITWGNNGLFKITNEDMLSKNVITSMYGVSDTIVNENIVVPNKFIRIISGIVNSIVNFFRGLKKQ